MSGQPGKKSWLPWVIAALVALAGTAALTRERWLPLVRGGEDAASAKDEHGHAAGEHGHDEHGHDEHEHAAGTPTSVKITPAGLKNIGFQPLPIVLSDFDRTETLPAVVVERPGRTQLQLAAPLTGVVTKIYPVQGASVEAGSPMFDMRLTHEELVDAQSNFIRTAENLDVVNRELTRLKALSEGVIAGKRIIDQEYEKQRLEGSLRAERQALLLHGLNEEQVDGILSGRKLFQSLTVRAPLHNHESSGQDSGKGDEDHLFHMQSVAVEVGQQVEAGAPLCVLADHCELYLEGRAFEDDVVLLSEAVRAGWSVSATYKLGGRSIERVDHLKLLYLSDTIDQQTRAFRFYLRLPNKIVADRMGEGNQRFIEWRFKPGQRMELHIPIERWEKRIVVPVEAVVNEGAEAYVYRQNGDHFDRVAVHVEYRDQRNAVIAQDGALFPGDVIAAGPGAAYQMHQTLKNQSGGAIDPHAGHNHG